MVLQFVVLVLDHSYDVYGRYMDDQNFKESHQTPVLIAMAVCTSLKNAK